MIESEGSSVGERALTLSVLLLGVADLLGGEGPAEAVRGGGQPMSRTWQRILTAKAVALSALLVAVATAGTERQLDADPSWHPRHEGYPPHVKPGW